MPYAGGGYPSDFGSPTNARPQVEFLHEEEDDFADPEPPPWYRRPPILFGAAAAAVLLAGGGLIAVNLTSSDEPSGPVTKLETSFSEISETQTRTGENGEVTTTVIVTSSPVTKTITSSTTTPPTTAADDDHHDHHVADHDDDHDHHDDDDHHHDDDAQLVIQQFELKLELELEFQQSELEQFELQQPGPLDGRHALGGEQRPRHHAAAALAAAFPVTRHAAAAELTASPTEPAKILVSGGIGTGKTSLLTEMRAALRAAGVAVIAGPPRDGQPAGTAVVVDDAHLLSADELEQLTELVGDPAATVVVAAEPLVHRRELTALTSALARSAPAVSLNPLNPVELGRAAVDVLGSALPAELIRMLATTTAGLPFLAYPALAAIGSLDEDPRESPESTVSEATRVALIERLRRVDDAVLDTLLVSSLSPGLGPDDVAAALDTSADVAQALVDRARASGLIAPAHSETFVRSLHQCLAEIIGAARHHDVELALLRSQVEKSTLSMDLALRMADHGLRDTQLADALIEFADRSQAHPDRVARLYRAAAEVGASVVSARLAEALALSGDCGTAGQLADELLTSTDPAERAAAVRIAASVAMHDGAATQAAELFRWLGPYPDAAVGVAGTIVSAGVGDIEAARISASIETTGPPTSSARAARCLAEGLVKTLDSPYGTAISVLAQGITADQASLSVSPDTPAALVTLTALHAGDAVRARSVIGRAAGAGATNGFFDHRHRLLAGWVHMQDGQLQAAIAQATAVADAASERLHRRDALWAAALQTGIATAQRRHRLDAEALVRRHGGADRVLDGPLLPAAARRAVDRRRPHAPARPYRPLRRRGIQFA